MYAIKNIQFLLLRLADFIIIIIIIIKASYWFADLGVCMLVHMFVLVFNCEGCQHTGFMNLLIIV